MSVGYASMTCVGLPNDHVKAGWDHMCTCNLHPVRDKDRRMTRA